MAGRWDKITVDFRSMRCFVTEPPVSGRFPCVVVVQHASGVDSFVQMVSDRVAQAGFVGIAPDLYHREDPNNSDDPLSRMGRLRDSEIVHDVQAAIAHASMLPKVRAERIGVTGFGMGGRVAYLMAANGLELKAAVVFYGSNIMRPWGEGFAPFDLSERIRCPVLGLFGEEDGNPNPADVAKIDAELTRLGKPHEFRSYAGAGHDFMSEGRTGSRAEVTDDAWRRCTGWFDRYLKQ